jgi:chlorobactene glucosyltransferase
VTVLAAVLFAFWVYVFLQSIFNMATAPRLRAGDTPSAQPLVSVVIPARNEAAAIGRTVSAFLAQDYPNLEVIVVDDRSTDGTGEILRAFADPRLTVVTGVEPPQGWLGKPWALDQGSRRSRGDVVLCVDADIVYAPPAVRAAVADLERHDVAMLTLLPHIIMRGFGENVGMSMLGIVAFMGLPLIVCNRVQKPFLGVGGGTGNMLRRKDLEAIDYFTAIRGKVVDDVGVAWHLRETGRPTRAVRADDLVSVHMYRGAGEIVRGFTKNMFSVLRRSYALAALMLVLTFVLHVAPYALALAGNRWAIATVALISASRLVVFRSLRYSLLSALFLHPVTMFFWAYIVLRSIWFTGIRGQLEWRGRTYDATKTER